LVFCMSILLPLIETYEGIFFDNIISL